MYAIILILQKVKITSVVLNCVVSALDTKRSMRLWFPVADVDLDGSINSFDFQHHFDYQIFRLEEFFIQPPNPEAVLQDLYAPPLFPLTRKLSYMIN